jgi:hypothetical protein
MTNEFDKKINERINWMNEQEKLGKRKKKKGRPYSYTPRKKEE